MYERPFILLIGPSGSGKSTIADILWERNGWKEIKSYTTRLRRYPGENTHTFITEEEFRILKNLVAYTEYDGHRYGATADQVDKNDVYVIDVNGLERFVKNYNGDKRIIGICIDPGEDAVRQRMRRRGDFETTIDNRIANDKIAFEHFYDKVGELLGKEHTYHIAGNRSIEQIVSLIESIVKVEM